MNKNTNHHDRQLLQLVLRAQHLARKDARTDEGYAMMLMSIVTILIFSVLGAFLTMANLNTSSTNAYIDSSNTFYAAESGLNARAEQLRQKFIGYVTPSGTSPGSTSSVVTAANVVNCLSQPTTAPITGNDFECRNYSFRYTRNSAAIGKSGAATSVDKNDLGGSAKITNRTTSVTYNAYTFVADRTNYDTTATPAAPVPATIPAGETYAGLNSLEYRYTIYATAAKPDSSSSIQASDAKTVLEMTFKSRIVPLFQFAAFYNEDLEMSSTSTMTLSGRVHTNANLYLQPTPILEPADPAPAGITTYLWSPVTSAGEIYNRVDSSGIPRYSPPRFLQSGNPFTNSPAPVYYPDNNFRADISATTAMTAPEITAFGGRVRDGNAGAQVLTTPDAGFLRKRNYFNGKVGEYYAKADIRLEMVPDRDVINRTSTPTWTRNAAIIPFNFTSIQTGGSGACTTTAPAAGSDPAPNYIVSDRQNASNLKCNLFTKGQLQSLRQPVMVRTNLNQTGGAGLQATELTVLRRPTLPTTGIPTISAANKAAVLRALQVALVSTPTPVTLDRFDTVINTFTNSTGSMVNAHLGDFYTSFDNLLGTIAGLTATERTALQNATPNQIAAIDDAWFLPAPIQRVEHNNAVVDIAANLRRSGFYDGREQRWITMLQTNILSLSVWNRDSFFVEATNQVMTDPYATNVANLTAAFNNGSGGAGTTNSTAGLAFLRAPVTGTTGLPALGLGASDGVVDNTITTTTKTEGGLVFYSTVNDDLDGNGTVVAANDITADSANPIYKRNTIANTNTTEIADYPRRYLGGASTGVSPFGFAFNGGDYLPGPLTVVTDQPAYIQGDFNNNGAIQPTGAPNIPDANRQPASILADTITILSNQCLPGSSVNSATPPVVTNYLNTPTGQINCGLPSTGRGSAVDFGENFYTVTGPTAVNAAFLASIVRSFGNLGVNRGWGTSNPISSGGLNNYMRMLEGWGQAQYFNYSGSFVSLGAPLEHNAGYIAGTGIPGGVGTTQYYNIPVRNYNFDTKFNSFGSLPPLSPRSIYLQQDIFRRNY